LVGEVAADAERGEEGESDERDEECSYALFFRDGGCFVFSVRDSVTVAILVVGICSCLAFFNIC